MRGDILDKLTQTDPEEPEESERYFVDERSGCIAVRDREYTDADMTGLHSDTQGVVFYSHGEPVSETCPTCGNVRSAGWTLKPHIVKAAHALCEELNAGDIND